VFHKDGPSLFELIVQGLQSTDRGYDLLAPKFERTPFRTPDALLEVAAGALGEVDRALDLCCGTGAAMAKLAPRCRRAVVGLDRSAGMLAEAQRRLAGHAHASLVRGDALDHPFRGSFDAVVSFGAFGHILEEDEPRLVASVKQALVPGGRFAFATIDAIGPSEPAWWMARGFNAAMRIRNALIKPEFVMYYLTFTLPRARALLEAEGFSVEVKREVFPRPYQRAVLVIATR
jgi:SAM-dependent methyltransferase